MSTRLRLLAPLLVLSMTAAACSGASSPTPGGSSAPAASASAAASAMPAASAAPGAASPVAICADAATFRASVTALKNLQLLSVGANGVKAALGDVQSSAAALLVSGKDLVGPPLAALLASVTALQATVTSLGDQPSLGAKVVAIKAAIEQITAAAADVETTLGTTCPA